MIVENPNRTESLISKSTKVWESSVKATHTFLTEKDIIELHSFVETGIKEIENLIIVYDNYNNPIGFMGIAQRKVEMLFLDPACIGKGIGKSLITKAIHEYEVLYVDVNEQNPHAVDFYKRFGFEVFQRTEFDEQCRPFPILRMQLDK